VRRNLSLDTFRGLLVLLVFAAAAAAQQAPAAPFVGRTLDAVVLSVEGEPSDDPSLKGAVQTKTGRPLSMADVRETIEHLYSFGRFDDVLVEAQPAADGGVTLRYELEPVHNVTRVEFRGTLGLPEGTLRSRVADRFGATPSLSRANDVAAALVDLFHERGYFSATVTPAPPILEHAPHRATAVFDVNAGSQTRIAKSNVLGHPLEPVESVRARLQIAPEQPYEPGELQRRLTEYIAWMRRQQHFEAGAHEERPVFSDDRLLAEVTVNVEPGPRVRVQFEGDPLPSGRIADLVPIEREGSVDPDLLEDSARRIQDLLNQQGFWKAEVKPPEQREADGELVLVFHIARGPQFRVAPGGVVITGNTYVPTAQIEPLLRTNRLTPGELFVESNLTAVENAIRLMYLRRGFVQIAIASGVDDAGNGQARPTITIKEGTKVTIGDIRIAGNKGISTDDLMKHVTIKTGDSFFRPAVAATVDQLTSAYLNKGFASVAVRASDLNAVPTSTGEATSAVTFTIDEGPQTIVEHVFVTGNVRTRPDVILRELRFRSGDPLGQDALTESRRRLSALGLFRRIQIQTISHGDGSASDVIIIVEEAPRTTIGYGGGLQVDRILRDNGDGTTSERYEVAPRGFFEVIRRNLGGTNRSIDLYSRLSLRPSTTSTNNAQFTEYRVVATYREPRAFNGFGDLSGTAAVEQGVRTGFNFDRRGVNMELTRRLARNIRGSVRYSLGTTHVFDLDPSLINFDPSLIDRAFPQVRLSTVSLALSRDTRDDFLEPQKGTFLSADGTLAARAIGSEVGYFKTYLQGFVYKNLGRPRLVFAGGARLGLADPFPRPAPPGTVDADGNPITTIEELPASERFFAGGSTTIRGYAVDTVGVPATISPSGVPIGGDATVILNAELRTPVVGPVGAVFFVDGGNVYPRVSSFDLTELRGSVGTGLRIKSPIGPIRLDIGFKLDRRVIGGKLEPGYAIHFSIGQAF
jgi:outer membrane protein insertion porin family